MNIILNSAKKKYSLSTRILVLVLCAGIFLFLIPYTLLRPLPRLDAMLGIPSLFLGIGNYILGGILMVIGAVFAWWSILAEVIRADGTPLPVMPTQTLLVDGPFKYCRNPMIFGTFLAYLGVSFIAGSVSAAIAVLIFTALILLYIKKIEEKELAARFGQPYLDYKARTPFLVPGRVREN